MGMAAYGRWKSETTSIIDASRELGHNWAADVGDENETQRRLIGDLVHAIQLYKKVEPVIKKKEMGEEPIEEERRRSCTLLNEVKEIMIGLYGNFKREDVELAIPSAVKTIPKENGEDYRPKTAALMPETLERTIASLEKGGSASAVYR